MDVAVSTDGGGGDGSGGAFAAACCGVMALCASDGDVPPFAAALPGFPTDPSTLVSAGTLERCAPPHSAAILPPSRAAGANGRCCKLRFCCDTATRCPIDAAATEEEEGVAAAAKPTAAAAAVAAARGFGRQGLPNAAASSKADRPPDADGRRCGFSTASRFGRPAAANNGSVRNLAAHQRSLRSCS